MLSYWWLKQLKHIYCAPALTEKPAITLIFHPSLKCILWSFTGLTKGSADPIAFAVDDPSHLCEVTVPPSDVIDSGGLHNESIV